MTQNNQTVFKIDLAEITGEGNFPCPKCGVTISPDDKTETVYEILDTKVKKQNLEALVILCKRCETRIRLVGFDQLE